MSKNPKIAAVEQYIKAICDHDLDAIESLYADNAVVEDPYGSEPRVGKAAIRKFYETGFSSGISARLDGAIRLAGDCAVFPFIVELNPGNGEMRIEVIDKFQFDEAGKITAMTAFWGPENTRTP